MENVSLTHRIVGAIVILSLAIIFIPLLLETDQLDPGVISESPIPEMPEEIKTIVFQLDEKSGEFKAKTDEEILAFEESVKQEIASAAKEIELPEEKPKTKVDETPDKPFPVEVNKPYEHTWMLQLASFKDRAKAVDFRDKLRKAKYTAHINERKFEKGSVWRVRVGPYVRKDEALDALAIVNKKFRVKGILVQRR